MADILYEVLSPVCPTCGKRALFGRPVKVSFKPLAVVVDDARGPGDLRGPFEVSCECGMVGVGYRALPRPSVGGLF